MKQQEYITAASSQLDDVSARDLNDNYLSMLAAGQEPTAFVFSGDLTARYRSRAA